MHYRAEIDGLRAVAVLPVILFHAGFDAFGGGFVGVDVFFVISGYLITRILIDDLERDAFSLIGFYERRVRRILPALFFVMACCVPFGWLWMSPAQFESFSKSLAATALFVSNILFWQTESYFAESSDLQPFIHMWSLAVEEQYYVLFPVVLFLSWRFWRERTLLVLALLAFASLGLTQWGWNADPRAVFYLLPTRAWELLAGSLCAILLAGRDLKPNGLFSAVGLAAILLPVFLYDEHTPFPGVYALAPVGGAALIILYCGAGTLVGRFLEQRLLVGLGLISYSIYLWHQPLFAFARLRSPLPPSDASMLALCGLTLFLAYVTWRYVEQPFRERPLPLMSQRKLLFAASTIAIAGFASFAAVVHHRDGILIYTPSVIRFAELDRRLKTNFGLHPKCDWQFHTLENCRTSDQPDMLLWGDSLAMHLAPALVASNSQIKLQQHTLSSCAPVMGLAQIDQVNGYEWARDCIGFNDSVFDWLTNNQTVGTVVLSSAFSALENDLLLRDGSRITGRDKMQALVTAFIDTVERIRQTGRKVVLVSPTVGNGQNVGQCLRRAIAFEAGEAVCDFVPPKDRGQAFRILEAVAGHVPIVRLDKMVCADGTCDMIREGVLMYLDHGHLSIEGSAYIGKNYGFADRVMKLAK